jgi:hypothetical protein
MATRTMATTKKVEQKKYHCCICNTYYKKEKFTPSSIERRITHCRRCQSKKSYKWRNSTEEIRIAFKLYKMERHLYGPNGVQFSTAIVVAKKVLELFEKGSVISGIKENLSMRRYWPDLPFSTSNAILLTANENRTVSRLIGNDKKNKQQHKWTTIFPEHIRKMMIENRNPGNCGVL